MKHIILIEPDHIIAWQYKLYLESLDYTVSICKDAQAAITAADKNRPSLVILELLLATHSGIEFLHEFRSYSEWRRVPIILLSNVPRHELPIDTYLLHNLGVSAYLYKPATSLKKLGQRVARLMPMQKSPSVR
jgi:DNA-binding response OmpR family regulator